MKIEGDTITFSTGKTRYANCGIIGIGPQDDEISEGYDSGLWSPREYDWLDHGAPLTKAELTELADYMIERWTQFRSAQGASESPTK